MSEPHRKIAFSPPDITDEEINEVIESMKSGWITTGPRTKAFEREIARWSGVQRAACLNSATAAMELTLRILGIGPGDEVITTSYTYSASAAIIEHVGAKIVFVDLLPGSYEMDYDKVAEAINENTKAVIPVDVGGRMCDYAALRRAIAQKAHCHRPANALQALYKGPVILGDAAHAFGASMDGIPNGLWADFTCFSFHAVKNLTTAEGGAAVWRPMEKLDDEWLYNQYMLFSLHGQDRDALAKSKLGSWEYDILFPGYKCNMTDILASFGLIQIKRYKGLLHRRREIMAIYDEILLPEGIDLLRHYDSENRSTGHLCMARFPGFDEKKRNRFIERMADKQIATNVHYKPLPMLTAYKNMGFSMEDFPAAYSQYENEATLPLHTLLSDDDAYFVAESARDIYRALR